MCICMWICACAYCARVTVCASECYAGIGAYGVGRTRHAHTRSTPHAPMPN